MIYYVEDDVNIRELVIYTLEKAASLPRVLPMGRRFGRPCRPSGRTWSCWTSCCPGRMG